MKPNERVLFIARRFPPSVGGMERFAYDLSNSLSKKVEMKKLTWGGSNKWLPLVLILFFFRASWILLTDTDRQIKVIHMQDAVQAPIGWLLSKLFRRPFLVVAHGLDITYEKYMYPQLILPFVRQANAVISISTATQDEALKRGVDKQKARVITLGTTDDYGNPRPDKAELSRRIGIDLHGRQVLLTTGRLVKRKGVAWFIGNVLPAIRKQVPGVLYLVAGDGAERGNIEAAVEASKMQGHVSLLGRVDDDVRALLYQSCDVFVMPNIVVPGDMEGFGIVAHEAASAGVPVVASDLEGIADALVNGKNGTLVQTRDTGAFTHEIVSLLKSSASHRIEIGKRSRKYTLETYSWSKIADKYVDVYKVITSASGRKRR